jgi:hypothetical protein
MMETEAKIDAGKSLGSPILPEKHRSAQTSPRTFRQE